MAQLYRDAYLLAFREGNPGGLPTSEQRDITTQLAISIALGFSAFTSFVVLRPRWSSLYAARKKHLTTASTLPDLPNSAFGWIPVLYRITEREVLASAGLDAYVFLQFFKMAIKFLTIATVLTATILLPIHEHYDEKPSDHSPNTTMHYEIPKQLIFGDKPKDPKDPKPGGDAYLWVYVIFVYLFSGIAFYLLYTYTIKVTRVRQAYLGHQSTITDRTIRLSGIPPELRSEEAIKSHIQAMGIGEVESVNLCRDWRELDHLILEREKVLRQLEEAQTIFLRRERVQRNLETLPIAQPDPPSPRLQTHCDEAPLLRGHLSREFETRRPTLKLRFGFMGMRSRKVDAIDHFTMKLGALDAQIKAARKREYPATPIAFVTLDSVAAAQMAMQAVLDPNPQQFLAHPAPAPSNIIWRNTYMPRNQRMLRSWTISIFIFFLTVIWLVPVLFLAGLLNTKSIRQVWPKLADALDGNKTAKTLMQNFVPTAFLTLLNIAVPYLYDYLSNLQGMLSQSDVELSVISKNFFFTFFNLFLAFSVFGTASNLYSILRDSLKDTTKIAYLLAQSLEGLAPFYTNLIVLQGIGMFPFRLLEFGEVALYPVNRIGAKTPRDHAELNHPPIFSYGFYLPQPILIFILCIVYSVLPSGANICAFGLLYFVFGYFTFKYQLLYAMDHPHHSTGQAWPMIVYRVVTGLVLFQVAVAGVLALKSAIIRSILVTPLLPFSVFFVWSYRKTFGPLNQYIALKAVRKYTQAVNGMQDDGVEPEAVVELTVDERRERGLAFVNPSLTKPLKPAWIHQGNGECYNGDESPAYRD